MAEVSTTGLVKTLDLTGDVAVMARYQGQVTVFRASVPIGHRRSTTPPAPKNFIDDAGVQEAQRAGGAAVGVGDDATFLRRSAVDIAGRLPTPAETEKFLADTDPAKRDKWIDTLLASTDYADYFANKWNSILRNKRRNDNLAPAARSCFTAGSATTCTPTRRTTRSCGRFSRPPARWAEPAGDLVSRGERQHRAGGGHGAIVPGSADPVRPLPSPSVREMEPAGLLRFFRILLAASAASAAHKSAKSAFFTTAGSPWRPIPRPANRCRRPAWAQSRSSLTADDDPRQALVDWMTAKDNKFFARRW
jgi:hypothetical protein